MTMSTIRIMAMQPQTPQPPPPPFLGSSGLGAPAVELFAGVPPSELSVDVRDMSFSLFRTFRDLSHLNTVARQSEFSETPQEARASRTRIDPRYSSEDDHHNDRDDN